MPAVAEQVSGLVRRVLAPNPGPFTFEGTQTYLVGRGDVAVIDPGPAEDSHVSALLDALGGDRLTHIVITHTHQDHSPAAAPLAAATGARIVGCPPIRSSADLGAGFDDTYAPVQVLGEGECVQGRDWTLRAVETPGHTSNHVCFELEEEKALFTGDHVMGWSTTVISPPDGSLDAYMSSLDKLLSRDDVVYYPAHGPAITEPRRLVRGLMAHRKLREGQILRQLRDGPRAIPSIVSVLYAGTAPELHGAAGRSVHAHLLALQAQGRVDCDGQTWTLTA